MDDFDKACSECHNEVIARVGRITTLELHTLIFFSRVEPFSQLCKTGSVC